MRPQERVRQRLQQLVVAKQWRDPDRAALEAQGGSAGGVLDVRSNDYLGYLTRPVSRETPPVGRLGAGASRLVSGTRREHVELERELAGWLGLESCLLFSSAYDANLGAIGALAQPGDVVFSDALNHASIIDGCRLSRAAVVVIPHRDLDALRRSLRERAPGPGTSWVVTESYFGMDGTAPDLRALREICDEADAGLIVDEAHALGIFGAAGQGRCVEQGIIPDLLVGGFGKAFALHGGFAAGSKTLCEWLWNRARSFVFSTAPSPWLCQVTRARLLQVRAADALRAHLWMLTARLEARLVAAGVALPQDRTGPLFPVLLGPETEALEAAAALGERRVLGHAIRPPTVPPGTSRIRVSLRADLSVADVDLLGDALAEVWQQSQARQAVVEALPREALPREALPREALPREALCASGEPAQTTAPSRSAPPPPLAASEPASIRRWVILGTGTQVGKTFVAEALVRHLAGQGHAVAGLKPVETGCRTNAEGAPIEGDAARLEAASLLAKHPRPHPLYAFLDPVAPSLAARREGQAVQPEAIASWMDRVRSVNHTELALVIETAGGVFSPVNDTTSNFDLAQCLGNATWVLVAPDRLGVLHEVRATLLAMKSLGRSPDWLVLNAAEMPDSSSGTNAAELQHLGVTLPTLLLRRGDPSPLTPLLEARPPTSLGTPTRPITSSPAQTRRG